MWRHPLEPLWAPSQLHPCPGWPPALFAQPVLSPDAIGSPQAGSRRWRSGTCSCQCLIHSPCSSRLKETLRGDSASHKRPQKRNPAATHLPPPWLPVGERVQGRRTGRFSPGTRQSRLVSGPHGRSKSGVMPLPTSPSGPAFSEICSKPGASRRPHDDIIPPISSSDHSAHKLGMKGNHRHKACVQRHRSPLHFITLSAHCPRSFHPSLETVFPCVLCLARFTHSCWQEIRSQEKGKRKPVGVMCWPSLPLTH